MTIRSELIVSCHLLMSWWWYSLIGCLVQTSKQNQAIHCPSHFTEEELDLDKQSHRPKVQQ